jgi:hypothetical protein
MYTMEMKRKIGGVAYVAQKKNLDGSPIINDSLPSISDINNLLNYLDGSSVSSPSVIDNNIQPMSNSTTPHNVSDGFSCPESLSNKFDEREMQKLIKRLIPYSQSLQGTSIHISHERIKLLAMIPSPIINKYGNWRLFFTLAPADLHENRFYELVQCPVVDNSEESWNDRTKKVCIFLMFIYLHGLKVIHILYIFVGSRV